MKVGTSALHWFSGSPATHDVVRTIAQHGPIARTQLAQKLNLTEGALSRITSDLIHGGVIEEAPHARPKQSPAGVPAQPASLPAIPDTTTDDKPSHRRGRPQMALRIRRDTRTFIGVDIHSTDITAIAVDALCRPLGASLNEPLQGTEPGKVTEQVARLATRCAASMSPKPALLGISLGGHCSENGTVTYAPFLQWNCDVALGRMVEEQCGIPTVVSNDLDALTLYESWFGAGVNVPRFALVTFGAGIGYALSEAGRPVPYADRSYGLVNHVPLDPEGPVCYAGHTGCSHSLTTDSIITEYSAMTGKATSEEEFFADVHTGKAQARKLTDTLCFRLGTFIAVMTSFAMPAKVLIDGEIASLFKHNIESIRSGISMHRPTQASQVDFSILDFSWDHWAQAAAARAIALYIG